jgi:hypothetical protein
MGIKKEGDEKESMGVEREMTTANHKSLTPAG